MNGSSPQLWKRQRSCTFGEEKGTSDQLQSLSFRVLPYALQKSHDQLCTLNDSSTARMGGSNGDNVHSDAPTPGANLVNSNPNMPRSIRARVGATSDPIPKGKHIEEPKHHHRILEQHHAPALKETEERTAGQEKEMHKDFIKEMQHARNEGGIDTKGAPSSNPVMQSVANKNMDSRKAHNGVMQSNKH